MEVALTFGSVGDIIALCNLAVKLGRALGESPCGSAEEYRGLQRDLDISVRVLSRVADAYSESGTHPQLNDLHALNEEVISDCERLVLEFLDRWEEKYENGLGAWSPARRAKKAWRSIQWSLRERERVQTLRDKLNQTIQTVTLLGNLASHGSARLDRARIMAGTQEVNNHVGHVHRAVVSIETAVADPVLRKALDPTKDMPLFVEDPLGKTIEIPLGLVHSWEMFHIILAHQFENRRGYKRVLDHHYALEETHTAQDVDSSLPLARSVRRGMRIHMSIVFENLRVSGTSCPGCQVKCNVLEGTNCQCPNPACGMWFRMQKMAASDATDSILEVHVRDDLESRVEPDTPSNFHRVRVILRPLRNLPSYNNPKIRLRWRCYECRSANLSTEEEFCPTCNHQRCEACTWSLCVHLEP